MAIDRAALTLWELLKGKLPLRPAVLEIGQANWFGDVSAASRPELAGIDGLESMDVFALARAFYSRVLGFSVLDAIDLDGVSAWRFDLNCPLPLKRRYDIIINTGTTEHVFDQRQAFESIHHWTMPGGVMVHAFPVSGCVDHGFFNYQPNMLDELMRANRYETLAALRCKTGDDEILHLAWRKIDDMPFAIPQQQKYAGVMGGVSVPTPTQFQEEPVNV